MTFYPPCNLQGSLVHGLRQVSGVWGESKKDSLPADPRGHPSTSPLFPPSRERSGSFTFSSGAGSPLHLPQLTRSRHTSTSSHFWTADTLGRGCRFMSHSTSVSDYEQPVQSMQRLLLSSHDRIATTFLRMRTADIFSIT